MKQLVCSNCKNSVIATIHGTNKKICPICGHTEFIEVDLPETVKCTYCKKVSSVEDVLKIWKDIPFYNSKDNTFYCGCKGWED